MWDFLNKINPVNAIKALIQAPANKNLVNALAEANKQIYGTTNPNTYNVPGPNLPQRQQLEQQRAQKQIVDQIMPAIWNQVEQTPKQSSPPPGTSLNPNTGTYGYYVDKDGNRYSSPDEYYQAMWNKQQQAIIDAAAAQRKSVDEYLRNNPTAYDDAWVNQTKQQIKEEVGLDPYFKEKMSNYLEAWETKRTRANEDETTFLKEIERQEEVYKKEEAVTFKEARQSSLEGLSDSGLLDSGKGMKSLRRQERMREDRLKDYDARKDYQINQFTTQKNRLFEDLDRDKRMFETDVEREKRLREETLLQQRKHEKEQSWYAGLQKAQGQIIPGYL